MRGHCDLNLSYLCRYIPIATLSLDFYINHYTVRTRLCAQWVLATYTSFFSASDCRIGRATASSCSGQPKFWRRTGQCEMTCLNTGCPLFSIKTPFDRRCDYPDYANCCVNDLPQVRNLLSFAQRHLCAVYPLNTCRSLQSLRSRVACSHYPSHLVS